MNITYLGDNISDLRKSAGISQEEFADRLKVSRQAVSKWERNEAYPDTENLIAIAKFFNVSIDDLINKDLTSAYIEKNNENEQQVKCEEVSESQSEYISNNIHSTEDAKEKSESKQGEEKPSERKTGIGFWMSLPYPIVLTVIFAIWGFCFDGFDIAWTIYITIPLYYTLFPAIKSKRIEIICYPALVAFLYCLFGMAYGIWHPLWVIFLTIPLFYSIAPWINRILFKK